MVDSFSDNQTVISSRSKTSRAARPPFFLRAGTRWNRRQHREAATLSRFSQGQSGRSDQDLPSHYKLTRSQLVFSGGSIAVAFLVLGAFLFRLAMGLDLWQWWVPVAFAGGMAAADFGSGLVHWTADTWGRDDLPLIGRRLLVPFRVHHINPDDFLHRRFIETNGDVAFLAVPIVLSLFTVPLDTAWGGPAAVCGFSFCAVGMMTNQIHQWAHMPSPPFLVRALQGCRLLLGHAEHAAHHHRPYDVHYCITTGWCNRPFEAIGFFRHLEAAITHVTGVRPRHDDRRYEARYGGQPPRAKVRFD